MPHDDLDAILDDLWDRLVDAASRARPAFHLPAFATVDDQGLPAVRTVVLRHADRELGTLACHTDRRSPKLAQLGREPTAAWLFYDAAARLQVRATGPTAVHADGPRFDRAWAATPPQSRRCYLAPLPPGTPADVPTPNLPDALLDRDPTPAEGEAGADRFAVLETRVERIDWLFLRHDGHRRATFERTGGGWRRGWVAV